MPSNLLRTLYFLNLILLVFWGCQSVDSLDTDAIIRINRQMCTQFQQEQHQELTSIFSDSAMLIIPGNYQVIGKQMIQAFWNRYINPVDLTIKHLNFYSSAADVILDANIPVALKNLVIDDSISSNQTAQSVYQWVDWRLEYESEDGVIRHETHPTLLLWRDDETGWRIDWIGQI